MENPTIIELASNLTNQVAESSKGLIRGEGLIALEEISRQRKGICNSCEFINLDKNKCLKCGCNLNLKTMLKKARCPIDKWSKV